MMDSRKRKTLFGVCIAGIGLVFLIWNILTPLVADDFAYAFIDSSMKARVGSIGDILYSMWIHTHETNGRLIPHSFVEFFIWNGKGFFNVVNTAVYLLFGLLIYRFVNRKREYNVFLFLGIEAVLLLVYPVYGQTMLWLDGACNYLWGVTFILMFLYLYYRYYLEPERFCGKKWILLAVVGGFFAGGVSENSSAACVAGVFLFLALYRIKKIKIPVWAWCGWITNLLCWVGLILSPANFLRKEAFPEAEGILDRWLNRFATCNKMVIKYGVILILIYIILFAIEYQAHKISDRLLISAVFFLMFLGANYSMIMVPFYPERAMTGAITFLVIADGLLLEACEIRQVRMAAGMAAIFVAAFCVVTASGDILSYYRRNQWREAEILADKAEGNMDVETYLITPRSRYCAAYGLGAELNEDKKYWKNKYMAAYYELDSIVKKSEDD